MDEITETPIQTETQTDVDENNLIVNSFKTILEMMEDRGTNADLMKAVSNEELRIKLNNSNIFDIDINEEAKIIYNMNSRVKIIDMLSLIDQSRIKYIMFVFKEKPNATVVKNARNSFSSSIDIQIFCIKEVSINISKHKLVPKHVLIKDSEKIQELVAKYSLTSPHQFPLILKEDPMAKYLNAKAGDIVQVHRYSKTSGIYINYRYCV